MAGQDVAGLVESLYQNKGASERRDTVMSLSNLVRQGDAATVLEILKTNVKSGVPERQETTMAILDELTVNCGPSFAVMLSSQKWMDRLIKLAKAGPPNVTNKIISTVIGWQMRYHTVSFAQCIKRLRQSKSTSEACIQALRAVGDDGTGATICRSADSGSPSHSSHDGRRGKRPDAILAELQSDLVSLEYSLENPQFVQDDAIAKECKGHKMKCMQMLESGSYESIASDLMQLIERFSQALELYECMTGVDMGEGEAARARALTGKPSKDNGGDSDDEYSKQLRARVAPQNAQQVMLKAQEATQQLVEQERNETIQLRAQLEEMRRKYEDMHNKYKDAKRVTFVCTAVFVPYFHERLRLATRISWTSRLLMRLGLMIPPVARRLMNLMKFTRLMHLKPKCLRIHHRLLTV
uniref:Uncharacterized protein TCIL3000_10_12750 n=1 Tax=Trypanosoma congolense (strain IL3000) TaxID=1068625 RepID=G0UYM6_TRYCI|nr:unnamed protein product [Trypanosoma congolense IL3000]